VIDLILKFNGVYSFEETMRCRLNGERIWTTRLAVLTMLDRDGHFETDYTTL